MGVLPFVMDRQEFEEKNWEQCVRAVGMYQFYISSLMETERGRNLKFSYYSIAIKVCRV